MMVLSCMILLWLQLVACESIPLKDLLTNESHFVIYDQAAAELDILFKRSEENCMVTDEEGKIDPTEETRAFEGKLAKVGPYSSVYAPLFEVAEVGAGLANGAYLAYMVGSSINSVVAGCSHGDEDAYAACLRTTATVTWNLIAGMGCFWALKEGVSLALPEAAPFLQSQLGDFVIGTLGQPLLEVCMSLVNIVGDAWEASSAARDAGLDELDKAFHCGSWSAVRTGILYLALSANTFLNELFIGAWDAIKKWFHEIFSTDVMDKSIVSIQISPVLRDHILASGYDSLRLEVRCFAQYNGVASMIDLFESWWSGTDMDEALMQRSEAVKLSPNLTSYVMQTGACDTALSTHAIIAKGSNGEVNCFHQDDLQNMDDNLRAARGRLAGLNQSLAMVQCGDIDSFCVTTADGDEQCFSAVEGRFEFASKPVKIDFKANMMARIKMIHSDEKQLTNNPYWQFHTYHWVNQTQSGMDISHYDYTAWCVGTSTQHCTSPIFVVEVGSLITFTPAVFFETTGGHHVVAPFTFASSMLVPEFIPDGPDDVPVPVRVASEFAALLDENNEQVYFEKIGVLDGFQLKFTYVSDHYDAEEYQFVVNPNATRTFGAYLVENINNIDILPEQFPNFNGYLYMTYENEKSDYLDYDMSQCNNVNSSDNSTKRGPPRKILGAPCSPNDPGHFNMTSDCEQAPKVCISATTSICFEVYAGSSLIVPVRDYVDGGFFNISTTPDVTAFLFTVPKGSSVESFRDLSQHGYINASSSFSVSIPNDFDDQLVLSANRVGADPLVCLENSTGKKCCYMGPSNSTVLCVGQEFEQVSKVSFNSLFNCQENCTMTVGDKILQNGDEDVNVPAAGEVSIQILANLPFISEDQDSNTSSEMLSETQEPTSTSQDVAIRSTMVSEVQESTTPSTVAEPTPTTDNPNPSKEPVCDQLESDPASNFVRTVIYRDQFPTDFDNPTAVVSETTFGWDGKCYKVILIAGISFPDPVLMTQLCQINGDGSQGECEDRENALLSPGYKGSLVFSSVKVSYNYWGNFDTFPEILPF